MDRLVQIRAFCRLVERRSFSAVARDMRVGQSTVSKWLKDLEAELGVRLLDRTTRAVRVTEAGRAFHAEALGLLDAYDAAVARVRHDDGALSGGLRVSLPEVFGRRRLLSPLMGFARAHPALSLQLVFADRYVDLVEEGFDVALRIGTRMDSSLQLHPLGDAQRLLVAAPAYLEHAPPLEHPADLAAHACLVHTRIEGRAVWDFAGPDGHTQVAVSGRIAANNSDATRQLACDGFGVARLADWLVEADLAEGRLVYVLPSYASPSAPIHALTPPGRMVPRRVAQLISHLRTALSAASAG